MVCSDEEFQLILTSVLDPDPDWSSLIRTVDPDPKSGIRNKPILDLGSRDQKRTRFRIRIRNTSCHAIITKRFLSVHYLQSFRTSECLFLNERIGPTSPTKRVTNNFLGFFKVYLPTGYLSDLFRGSYGGVGAVCTPGALLLDGPQVPGLHTGTFSSPLFHCL